MTPSARVAGRLLVDAPQLGEHVGRIRRNAQRMQAFVDEIRKPRGRTVLEETRAEARTELVSNLEEGQTVEGTVKNITDYGAFVDLGGIDGLLHVTDMAWRRVNHPSEVVTIGQHLKVKIIKINHDTHRISLGIKQLLADPWEGIDTKYPLQSRLKGRVTNITDYGAFLELEPGIEGLIHVSEMSWTKKNVHPGKIVSTSQEVDVQVLEVDQAKRRISLGLKQTLQNPWEAFLDKHPVGSEVEGEIRNIFWRRTMQKRIHELKDHFIVCGPGDTGRSAVEELHKTGTPFLVCSMPRLARSWLR